MSARRVSPEEFVGGCVATLLWLTLVAGCATHGPQTMQSSRLAYNEAVQLSEQRELLLNLIRLRYLDAPEFLAINGISTQMTVEGSATIGGVFGEEGGDNTSLVAPGASVGYSETPTITFTPQRGRAFTRQLVAPVEIDSVYLLTRYGWGIDRVLRLVGARLNGVSNELSRESAEPAALASVETFGDLVAVLRERELVGQVRVGVVQERTTLTPVIPAERLDPELLVAGQKAGREFEYQGAPPGYVLVETTTHYRLDVEPDAWKDPAFLQLAARLGLREGADGFELDPGAGAGGGDRLLIDLRSILGVLAYLSAAVEVPGAHRAQVLPPPAADLSAAFADLLRVHVSSKPVTNAWLAVPYRDYWFYVADDDLESKKTLGLLNSLVRLSITAGGAQNVPVLTLPVGR